MLPAWCAQLAPSSSSSAAVAGNGVSSAARAYVPPPRRGRRGGGRRRRRRPGPPRPRGPCPWPPGRGATRAAGRRWRRRPARHGPRAARRASARGRRRSAAAGGGSAAASRGRRRRPSDSAGARSASARPTRCSAPNSSSSAPPSSAAATPSARRASSGRSATRRLNSSSTRAPVGSGVLIGVRPRRSSSLSTRGSRAARAGCRRSPRPARRRRRRDLPGEERARAAASSPLSCTSSRPARQERGLRRSRTDSRRRRPPPQAPRGEEQRLARRGVEPVGVVDGDEQRLLLGRGGSRASSATGTAKRSWGVGGPSASAERSAAPAARAARPRGRAAGATSEQAGIGDLGLALVAAPAQDAEVAASVGELGAGAPSCRCPPLRRAPPRSSSPVARRRGARAGPRAPARVHGTRRRPLCQVRQVLGQVLSTWRRPRRRREQVRELAHRHAERRAFNRSRWLGLEGWRARRRRARASATSAAGAPGGRRPLVELGGGEAVGQHAVDEHRSRPRPRPCRSGRRARASRSPAARRAARRRRSAVGASRSSHSRTALACVAIGPTRAMSANVLGVREHPDARGPRPGRRRRRGRSRAPLASQRSACASSHALAIAPSSFAPGAASTKRGRSSSASARGQRARAEDLRDPLLERLVRLDRRRPQVVAELVSSPGSAAPRPSRRGTRACPPTSHDDRPAARRGRRERERRGDRRLADAALSGHEEHLRSRSDT